MTDFRSLDLVAADFRRLDPNFRQITSAADLLGVAQMLDGGTSGPALFNLGVVNGPEWEGVNRFLNSRLVTPEVRGELQRLQRDLQDADTDHDGFLNNQEIVAFAQVHADRWPNVVTFRSAADLLLNRLPSYLAQPDLNSDQISHLWGVMNQLAREWDQAGAHVSNRGLVYGLSLAGFPSTDTNNPPDLIRRALRGELDPDELAAVHHILQVQRTPQGYNFQSGTNPMNPIEIGALSLVLDRAAQAHHMFRGMALVTGDAETQLYAARNRSLDDCHAAVRRLDGSANQADADRSVDQTYADCAASLNRVETDQNAHPDQIGIHEILLRARAGMLTPAETAALRAWMIREQQALGISTKACSGALECFGQGALSAMRQLITNPHNLAFIGGGILYRRLLLRNLFARQMTELCGGPVANPGQAYRDYERSLSQEMLKSPRWQRILNQLIRNPRAQSFWGKAGINFPVNVLHIAAFSNLIAHPLNGVWNSLVDPRKHPILNEALQYLTDAVGILLFNGWETVDAVRRPSLQRFQQAHPEVCRQESSSAQVSETVPEPEPSPETTQERMSLAPDADPELADLLQTLHDSRSLVPNRSSVAPGYLTLDQISVGTPATNPNGAGGRPVIPGSPIMIPNLEPIFTPKFVPALRPR